MPPKKKSTKSKPQAKASSKMSETDQIIETTPEPIDARMFEPDMVIENLAEAKAEPGPAEPMFTCFPKLPTELRLKVWKYTCCVTRNVDIWVKTVYVHMWDFGGELCLPHQFISKCPPPAILHVCKESRTQGLHHYTLDFGSSVEIRAFSTVAFTVSTPPRFYFKWEFDRLCLMNPAKFDIYHARYNRHHDLVERCVEKKLRFMACNIIGEPIYWPDGDFGFERLLDWIPWTANLEELVLFAENVPEWNFEKEHRPEGVIDFVDVGPKKDKDGENPLKYCLGAVNHELNKRSKKDDYDMDLRIRTCEIQITPRKSPYVSNDPWTHNVIIKSWMGPGVEPPPGAKVNWPEPE